MGVIRFKKQIPSAIAPSWMFNAFILDAHNFLPKVVPEGFKSIGMVEGDGGAGTINGCKYAKHKIDALDKDKLTCKYAIFEGDMLEGILDSIVYDYKFEGSKDGGSICMVALEYHTKGDQEIKEEDLKAVDEKGMGLYKIVEAYLLVNPDVYA